MLLMYRHGIITCMCRLLYVDGVHCNPIIIDCVARPTSCMWLILLPACTHMYMYIYNTCKDSLFLLHELNWTYCENHNFFMTYIWDSLWGYHKVDRSHALCTYI